MPNQSAHQKPLKSNDPNVAHYHHKKKYPSRTNVLFIIANVAIPIIFLNIYLKVANEDKSENNPKPTISISPASTEEGNPTPTIAITKTPTSKPTTKPAIKPASKLTSQSRTQSIISDWSTYTYKNMLFRYPKDWDVNSSNPDGSTYDFSVSSYNKASRGIQTEGISLTTLFDGNIYRKSPGMSFSRTGESGDDKISFIMDGVTIYASCSYYKEGQKTIDLCNQILKTFKFTR